MDEDEMDDRVPMTQEGYEKLKEELRRLKTRDRYEIAKEIEIAREHGDLSENAEYEAAKDKQGHVEAKIRDLEDKLARADVIDPSKISSDKVVFGATVELEDLDTGEEIRVQIVGPEEGDAKKGRVSVHSPLARALIGKEVEDEAVVNAPGGTRSYEVKSITFS
jgi:transcription elongation factor GreA